MTKKQALQEFRSYRLPSLGNDKPAIRQAWSFFTDGLCKAGLITERQYDTWVGPPEGR